MKSRICGMKVTLNDTFLIINVYRSVYIGYKTSILIFCRNGILISSSIVQISWQIKKSYNTASQLIDEMEICIQNIKMSKHQ